MQITPAVRSVLEQFDNDISAVCSTVPEMTAYAVKDVSEADAPAVRAFLDAMTGGKHSPAFLEDFWKKTSRYIGISDGNGVAALMQMLRDSLDARFPP